MFWPEKENKEAKETVSYSAGVYTQAITLNDSMVNVEVVVDKDHINSIALVNLDESVAAMYPLMQPALDNISQQIYESQSVDNIKYSKDSQYTSTILLQAITQAVEKAKVKELSKKGSQ